MTNIYNANLFSIMITSFLDDKRFMLTLLQESAAMSLVAVVFRCTPYWIWRKNTSVTNTSVWISATTVEAPYIGWVPARIFFPYMEIGVSWQTD